MGLTKEFLKAVGALTAVFQAAAITGCLGSDLCSVPGTEAWWATIGHLAVYSPIISFAIVLGFVMIRGIVSKIRGSRARRQLEEYMRDGGQD